MCWFGFLFMVGSERDSAVMLPLRLQKDLLTRNWTNSGNGPPKPGFTVIRRQPAPANVCATHAIAGVGIPMETVQRTRPLPRDELTIVGARALLPNGALEEASVRLEGGRIVECTGDAGKLGTLWMDGRDLLLLPGIVDLHGDAFEHSLMPRSGVRFPVRLALEEVDRQLLGNGITTAFHGITWSWEPGLRGRDTVIEVIDALEAIAPRLGCDTRVHLRHELHNLDAEDEILQWLADSRIGLLALNDHLEMIQGRLDRAEKVSQYAERSGLTAGAYRDLVERVGARTPQVADSVSRLCRAASAGGLPMASHEDETPEMRRHYRALGAGICEFPCNAETAREAMAAGESVVLGSPNVLRGRSHDGRLSAGEAIAGGLCSVLASDYYYPALLGAPFFLSDRGLCDFATAWRLVSEGPARAAGLADRGILAPGQRADLLLVDARDALMPRVVATIVAGRVVQTQGTGMLERLGTAART